MQDHDDSSEPEHVQDAMLEFGVYSKLPDAKTDRRHRFPIFRLSSLLHPPKLTADNPTDVVREASDDLPRVPKPYDGPGCHEKTYKCLYVSARTCAGRIRN